MAQGKFSNPRPHRDEERQIEQAFRQVTGQAPAPQPGSPLQNETDSVEQVIREVQSQQTAPQTPRYSPTVPNPELEHTLIPENVDSFFRQDPIMPEEEVYEGEPDFVDKLMAFGNKALAYCRQNQKVVMVSLCGIAMVVILSFIAAFFFSAKDPYDGKILNNVMIADIPVGGMTKNEAIDAVKKAAGNTYTSLDMVIDLSGTELRLSPKDTKAQLDIKAAVNAAYDYGRTGTKTEQEQAASSREPYILGALPYLDLDTDYIKQFLISYAQDAGSTLTQATYGLEGKEPELSADLFDEDAPTQTLVITMGTPGVGFDVNEVYDKVLDAYSLHEFLVEVENVEDVQEPDPVDLEAIYEEFYIEPVNATVNLQTYKTEPGSYGYGFDMKAAQKLIDKAEYGEEIRIPMEYIEPDLLDDDAFFRDTLGEGQTKASGNDSRKTNLRKACEAIDGTVLDPGEALSFEDTLGKLTLNKGYQSAAEDIGMEETVGGGVSQVSSTLYYAALAADLEIVTRANHGYLPSFIDRGLDATASLKIRNSTGYPIRIEADMSGGYVKIEIIGTEERDYYVMPDYSMAGTYEPKTEYKDFEFDNKEGYKDGDVIEEGRTGYSVKTYKIKYDIKTGNEISRDYITTSQYPTVNKIIAFVKPEPTTAPTTVPTEPPTSEAPKPTETQKPTEQPTEKPTETTQPPETAVATEPPTVPPTDAPTVPVTEAVVQETDLQPAAEEPQTEA